MQTQTASATTTASVPTDTIASPIVTDQNVTVASPTVDSTQAQTQQADTKTTDATQTQAADSTKSTDASGTKTDDLNDPSHPQANTPEWLQKRINREVAKRYEAERNAQILDEKLRLAEARTADLLTKAAGATDPNNPTGTKQLTEKEINEIAEQRASQIAAARVFNEACNKIVDQGKNQFKDTWDEAVRNLNMIGAIGKDIPPTFLENAIELKDPHKVLHYLGMHIDEGARISKLPPTRMAMELARVEAQLNSPSPIAVSRAPEPVVPVSGGAKPGVTTLDDPNISSSDWFALRSKQVYEKKNRYQKS